MGKGKRAKALVHIIAGCLDVFRYCVCTVLTASYNVRGELAPVK